MAENNLNLRISNGRILADFYTNRQVGKTKKNTRLTKSEYLQRCKERRQERAEKYRRLMKGNRWTQAKLSRYLRVSRVWVSRVLNAKE